MHDDGVESGCGFRPFFRYFLLLRFGAGFFLVSESSTVCKMGTILYLEDSVNWLGEQWRQRYEVGWGSSGEPSMGTQACGSPGSRESGRWVTLPPIVQTGTPRPRAWQERAQTSGPLPLPDDVLFSRPQFLLIFRKAAAGELPEDSGLHVLARLSEIDVSTEGVKGAKSFFEAKVRNRRLCGAQGGGRSRTRVPGGRTGP